MRPGDAHAFCFNPRRTLFNILDADLARSTPDAHLATRTQLMLAQTLLVLMLLAAAVAVAVDSVDLKPSLDVASNAQPLV